MKTKYLLPALAILCFAACKKDDDTKTTAPTNAGGGTLPVIDTPTATVYKGIHYSHFTNWDNNTEGDTSTAAAVSVLIKGDSIFFKNIPRGMNISTIDGWGDGLGYVSYPLSVTFQKNNSGVYKPENPHHYGLTVNVSGDSLTVFYDLWQSCGSIVQFDTVRARKML